MTAVDARSLAEALESCADAEYGREDSYRIERTGVLFQILVANV